MNYIVYLIALVFMVLPAPANWGIQGQAQIQGNMWGSGYWGGNQQCGYEVRESEDVSAKKEELKGYRDELKTKEKDLREAKSKITSARSRITSHKKFFQMVGFEKEHFSFIDNHITGSKACQEYERKICSEDPTGYDSPGTAMQSLDTEDGIQVVTTEPVISRSPADAQGGRIQVGGVDCSKIIGSRSCTSADNCRWKVDQSSAKQGRCISSGSSAPSQPAAGSRPVAPASSSASQRPALPTIVEVVTTAEGNPDSSPSAPPRPSQDSASTATPAAPAAVTQTPPTVSPVVVRPEPTAVIAEPSRIPATPACTQTPTKPFQPNKWQQFCGPNAGEIRPGLCDYSAGRARGYQTEKCKEYLEKWQQAQKELSEATLAEQKIKLEVDLLREQVKLTNEELKLVRREYQRELREQMSEGDCVDCIIQGGQVYSPRKASGLEIGANVAMGLASIYLGSRDQRYVSDNNAKLGFETRPYPSVLNGYPYFMNAIYGAVGGGIAGGAGCFNAGGGAQAGGGALWGYPSGMGQNGMMYPSGMMMPGQGSWGANGPWGNAMCMSWPCPMGGINGGINGSFGGGLPGMMGNNPWLGTPGFGGGFPGMGGGLGGGFQLGGLPGMGGMPGMMGYPGMSGMGDFGLGGGLGMGMGGLNGMGMGDLGMQSQMMQLQMQQMQQAMQMQQQRMQAQMAYQQQVSNLTQELNTVMMRLRQAQMGMYLGVSSGTTGTGTGTWTPTNPSLPSSTTPIGPPTFR